jgi:hypothetical protein
MVVHLYNPSYREGIDKRITFSGWPEANARPYPEDNYSKKKKRAWVLDLSCRAPN